MPTTTQEDLISVRFNTPALLPVYLTRDSQSLLANLGRVWGSRRAAGCTHTLQHLDLRLGQPAPGSQLPVFANPSWLMAGADSSSRRSGLVGDNLWLLAEITSLASLRCEVSSTGRCQLRLRGWAGEGAAACASQPGMRSGSAARRHRITCVSAL
jgi:hypothetical protein